MSFYDRSLLYRPNTTRPADKPLDYNKMYDGKEFQFNKRGNFGPGNYGVRVTKTGTPRDMAVNARATPIFGPPSQKVVDRSKFYDGKEFEFNKRGGYGPAAPEATACASPRRARLAT